MLIIRTRHDKATNILYVLSDEIIDYAQNKGFPVAKIEGADINLDTLRKRIKKNRPKFIFFNGHGSEESLLNNEEEEFIDIKSADIFRNTITFARACNSLAKLGSKAVEEGCKAYMGYNREFWIGRSHKFEATPKRDPISTKIVECSNVVPRELLKGKKVSESINRSQEFANKRIFELMYSKEQSDRAALLPIIYNNLNLDFKGDASATLN